MHSRWGDGRFVDARARRAPQRGARPRPAAADERIVADIDRHIADAAQAIDETISGPEDEDDLIGACEAIVVARERIEALRAAVKRSGAIVERSVELRKQAARQLYETLKARGELA